MRRFARGTVLVHAGQYELAESHLRDVLQRHQAARRRPPRCHQATRGGWRSLRIHCDSNHFSPATTGMPAWRLSW